MTSFVLNMSAIPLEGSSEPFIRHDKIAYNLIIKYAKLLKRNLSLDMFVPCDSTGKPIPEPDSMADSIISKVSAKEWVAKVAEFSKAKDKTLFKGFYVYELKGSSVPASVTNGIMDVSWFDKITQTWSFSSGLVTVEDLSIFSLDITPEDFEIA